MCGIAGIFDPDAGADQALLRRMCSIIEHRGPDARGNHVDGPIGLGVQRLAIIDVAGGHQPIANEDGSVVVVMNGEIYNHGELRERLRSRGHRFTTVADTEVLVHLYEEHGEGLVDHLRGMFAFGLWDARRRRLLLARDRVGKKPLFWARRGRRVAFASGIRCLLADPSLSREASPEAIDAYLALQYVPDPLSAFAAIHKLPPAHVMVVDRHGVAQRRYWQLDYTDRPSVASEHERAHELREHLREAVRIRLMSEVPLGAFLSGGVDSSAVVAAMAEAMGEPVKTFSIGFPDPEWDETAYARLVAAEFATDHCEFRVEPDAVAVMPQLARHYGEPFADPSAIPSFHLAELSSRHVTVALNGDGGDENFAGYGRYRRSLALGRFAVVPAPLRRGVARLGMLLPAGGPERGVTARARRLARALAEDGAGAYLMSLTVFDAQRRADLVTAEFAERVGTARGEASIDAAWAASRAPSELERMLDVDVRTYLPGDLLVKIDIATMAYSVEARSPFLDHVFMEWAAGLPLSDKLDGANGKRVLKRALRGWVPDTILDRPKMGFGVPLARWFREELRDLPAELLLDPESRTGDYVELGAVRRLIDEHHARTADHSLRLWALLQLESWHREVVEAPTQAPEAVR